MSIDDLSVEVLERIVESRFDRIVEKHEGPFTWDWLLKKENQEDSDNSISRLFPNYDPVGATPEFLSVGGRWVLLPVGREQHRDITILHHFLSEDQHKLVVYLKNTTYGDGIFDAGYVTICDRFVGEAFYVATLYHEWFVIDYDAQS